MRKIIGYIRPYVGQMLAATVCIAIATMCNLLLPTLMSNILNKGVYGKDFAYIIKCCLEMLLVALGSLIGILLGSKLSADVVAGFCADLRSSIFKKVNTLTFEEFGALGTAALVTRATHDVETVSWVASELCGSVITIPVLFFGGVTLTFLKDWVLGLVLLAVLPGIFAVVVVIGRKILPLWKKSDEYIDKQNDIMRERLRGIRVIRAFNAEPKEHSRIAGATEAMAQNIIKSNVSMGLITPLATLLLNLAMLAIVYLGGLRMELGASRVSGGDLFAIVQYVTLVTNGVVMAAFAIVMYPQASVAAGRVGQVLEAKGMADPVARQDLRFSGKIDLENVGFQYEGAAEAAIRDVTMHIAPGEKVAIIGGTGSGKSTLVSLLMGFRTPTSGAVRFDGLATRDLSRHTVRENISCVLQNSTIYSGTVRENIQMGRPGAADEEIWQALETAQAADFIRGFPEGLDHEIKQSGKNLSGGQKQRLSIARALLKKAPIYIFDDSFSALDFLTEARLRQALAGAIQGCTQILITQRVTSAMHCQCIYVMDRGRLVDHGTHEALLERCGVYQEIYASQTGGKK